MAYVSSVLEEEDKKEGQSGGEVVLSSGAPTTVQGAANKGGSGADKKASSSGWSNLQSYVDANKGNDVAMAGKIVGKVDNRASELQSSRNQFGEKVRSEVDKGTVRDAGVISGLQTSPTKVDKAQFQKQATATYQGPKDVTDFQEYGKLSGDVGRLRSTLDNTTSDEGRKSLLQESFKRSDYGQGMQNLDAFILGAAPESKKQIANLNEKYSSLENDWEQFNADLRDRITGAKQATAKVAADTNKAYETALGTSNKKIGEARSAMDTSNAARQSQFNSLISQIKSDDPRVRQQAYSAIGLNERAGEWMRANGMAPESLVKQSEALKMGNFLGAQDRANYEALLALQDKQADKSLAAKSATDSVFQADSTRFGQAKEAAELQNAIEAEMRRVNMVRTNQANNVRDKLNRGVFDSEVEQATGLSAGDLAFARSQGMDLGGLFSAGAAVNTGDVINSAQRQRWADLQAALGFEGNLQVQDTQNEGNAYQYNRDALLNQIGQRRAEIAAAEEAARRAEQERARQELERQQAQRRYEEEQAREAARADKIESAPGDINDPEQRNTIDLTGAVRRFGNWLSGK